MNQQRRTGRVVCLLGGAAMLVAGCGGNDKPKPAKRTTTTAAATTVAPAPASTEGIAPLTGLAGDPALLKRPALVVKIDNAPKARPQFGIAAADLVIEEGVEGGITRLAAVFHSADANVVGPVRSARSTDIHLATPLGQPLYAYSGAAPQIEAMLNRSGFVNVGINRMPGAYRREKSRPAPYNLFSSTTALFRGAPAGASAAQPLLAIGRPEDVPTGDAATRVKLSWVGIVRTDVTWTWDATAWRRVQNGTPQVDASGGVIGPRNVVVLFVNYVDTGSRDNSGASVPEAKLVGEGEAWVFRAGTLTRGVWRKPSDEAPVQLLDAKGATVTLLPGQTWVELPAPGMGSVG